MFYPVAPPSTSGCRRWWARKGFRCPCSYPWVYSPVPEQRRDATKNPFSVSQRQWCAMECTPVTRHNAAEHCNVRPMRPHLRGPTRHQVRVVPIPVLTPLAVRSRFCAWPIFEEGAAFRILNRGAAYALRRLLWLPAAMLDANLEVLASEFHTQEVNLGSEW
jgi:hypothetical protein